MADIGVRGVGPTQAAAFEQAALALTAVLTDPSGVHDTEEVRVTCQAGDRELLLVDWLNALIYEMAVRSLIFGRFEVTLSGDRLDGSAWGETIRRGSHALAVEVKGATLTALRVTREDSGEWVAQCVVDV